MIIQKRVKLILQRYDDQDVGYYVRRVTWCCFGVPLIMFDSVVVKS